MDCLSASWKSSTGNQRCVKIQLAHAAVALHQYYPELPPYSRHCSDGLKKVQTFFSQNWVSLAGKLFPPPVGVFCTHLEPPKCLIMQKSDFSGFYDFCDFPGFGIFGLLRKTSVKVCPSSGGLMLNCPCSNLPVG